ncbi:hypothetical protein J4230_04140 [Candidatus Woesearchaeota archaeon]|nr:hypothetical protein [Candidatus Woesearchaeota archaeon]
MSIKFRNYYLLIIFIIFLISLFLLAKPPYNAQATASASASITITDGVNPSLILFDPQNITYTTTTVPLNFFANDSFLSTVWYNLDNGANTTISANTTFTTASGSHTLRIYANDTGRLSNTTSVAFTVSVAGQQQEGGGTTGGGGGGGGGGASYPTAKAPEGKLYISKDIIKDKLAINENLDNYIKFVNEFKVPIKVTLDLSDISEFLYRIGLSKIEFELQPGEKLDFKLPIRASEDFKPDIYTGTIYVSYLGKTEEIPFVLEVVSSEPLFDIFLDIKENDLEPGENVLAEITITNIKETKQIDVNITYFIKDINGNTISEEKETRGFERQVNYVKRIPMPDYLKDDRYIIYIKVSHEDVINSASQIINIKSEKKLLSKKPVLAYSLVGFIVLASFFSILYLSLRKHVTTKNIFRGVMQQPYKVQKADTKARLEKQLKLLTKNYEERNITEDTYNKTKKKLEDMINKLDKK